MAIVRWDPFNGLVPLRNAMERMADQGFRPPVPFGLWGEGAMAVDMYETESSVVVKAPIPGLVVRVLVAPGQQVVEGEPLLILEAMKMENELRAPRAGVIHDVRVETRMLVTLGQVMLTLR